MTIRRQVICAVGRSRYRGEFFNLVDSEQADWSIEEHRNLLRYRVMLITTGVISLN